LSNNKFIFKHIETEQDILENLEIMRKVFGQNAGVDLLVKKLIYNHPSMTLKSHFIMKHQGKTVATLNSIPIDWCISNVPLKAAEMGCVATLPEYSNQGLMRRLVEEYHKQIDTQGFDLSVIEGIPYFYRQFGYEYALTLDEETTIPMEKLPDFNSNLEIRPFTIQDIPRAMELLAQSQSKFCVHSVRDEQIWKMQQETGLAGEYSFDGYAVEEEGKMRAHFRISRKPEEKKLILREATDTDYPTTMAILSFLKDTGKEYGLETLIARTSYCDPITKILATSGAEQRIPPYAWQIRVTDYVGLLQKMKPLFESRLAASEYRGLTEKLNLNFRRFRVQMEIENGFVTDMQPLRTDEQCIIGLNPPASIRLIFGYKSREELEACFPDFCVRLRYKRLIDVLFPKLPSHIHVVY
jgi:predicted acetyltransferase